MPSAGREWLGKCSTIRARRERCWICGETIDYTAEARTPRSFSVDHKTPTSLGGSDALSNLAAAHYGCNSSRGNATRGDFPTSRRW